MSKDKLDAPNKEKKGKKVISKMRHKSRLVVLNDDTFEEQFSLILSPLNVFAWGGVLFILFTCIIIFLIAFTPLREFIPGYADVKTKRLATTSALRVDSLSTALEQNKKYIENLRVILSGGIVDSNDSLLNKAVSSKTNTRIGNTSKEDSILRAEVEAEERYNLTLQSKENRPNALRNVLFYAPIKGVVTSTYDPSIRHYGVDIVSSHEDAAVKSVLEGSVIQATWTSDEGYVIFVQHRYNIVSVYKHNSVLLKKTGDKIKAGEAIAIVGNSGELTTGPHLHFELWHNGTPINPTDFVVF